MLERKAVVCEFKADGKPGEFTALFSVFDNIDRDGDRIHKGAFLPAFEKNPTPPIVWTHRWDIPPIGETLDAEETAKGARGHGKLFVDDHEIARQVYTGLKSGALTQFSFAYEVKRFELTEPEEDEKTVRWDGKIRELKEFSELYEWGPTLVGANPDTELLSAKGLDQLLVRAKELELDHDLLVAAVALLSGEKGGARNSGKHLERLQQIHDLAIANGASCEEKSVPPPARDPRVDELLDARSDDLPVRSGSLR